ncbi:MAG: SDR family NAD(P)-dependent oxidoreductase [Immundisolibacterales bacterium]|nr:SDR family NAD(P)-dependent oxidoreductase [Immundisolibacterales bacterium]
MVTGGARGIGLGCAMSLAAKGFNLALVDVLEDELEEATAKLRATGVQAESFVADVSDFARAAEIAGDILERFEALGVLVNNTGIGSAKGLLEISEAEWNRTIDVNLKGCFNWSEGSRSIDAGERLGSDRQHRRVQRWYGQQARLRGFEGGDTRHDALAC